MVTFMILLYAAGVVYAFMCAPYVFFLFAGFRPTPEFCFIYFVTCIFMSLTLVAIPLRYLYRDAIEEDMDTRR